QNESILDSNAPLAQDMRRVIRGLLQDGATDGEVYDFLRARYSDYILYSPPWKPSTWLLWLAPALLLLIGGGTLAMVLAARATQPLEDDDLAFDDDGNPVAPRTGRAHSAEEGR